MLSRFIAATVIVGASGTLVFAQTPMQARIAADDQGQVQGFEGSLRLAIVRAATQLAKRAREVAPNIVLQFESEARIKGVILPESEGLQFFVDVPAIEQNTAMQWQMSRTLRDRNPDVLSTSNGAPTSGRVPAPKSSDSVLMTDPPKEYSDFTHDALVDAMLDSSSSLPIKEGQTLTLIVSDGTFGLPRNPLAPPDRLLYLRMKGEDLLALRQNRITRDEAKLRIRQWAY